MTVFVSDNGGALLSLQAASMLEELAKDRGVTKDEMAAILLEAIVTADKTWNPEAQRYMWN